MLLTVVVFTGAAQAATFNAFADFQTASNIPLNRWSYWSTRNPDVTTYAATIGLMTNPFTGSCGFGTSCWFNPADGRVVLQNNTGGPVSFQTETVPNGTLALYPRAALSLMRFLAPTAGTYQMNGFFRALSSPQAPTHWAVVINGNSAGALLDSPGHSTFGEVLGFSLSQALNANDTVDFLAFRFGGPSNFNNLGATGFDSEISSAEVPEPSTLLLLGSGLAGWSGIAWRRRRRKNSPSSSSRGTRRDRVNGLPWEKAGRRGRGRL